MSQSIRSGKPAAPSTPSMSLADCFSAVVDSLQGQKPRRAARGLNALTGFEEHIKRFNNVIEEQKSYITQLEKLNNLALDACRKAQSDALKLYREKMRLVPELDEKAILQ